MQDAAWFILTDFTPAYLLPGRRDELRRRAVPRRF